MSSNPHTKRTIAAVVGLAVVAIGGLAGPATAATGTFEDARGDVAHGADLESVTVVNEKNVRVVVQHEDLVRSYKSNASMNVYLDTDPAKPGPEFVFAGGLFEGTDYGLLPTVDGGWKHKRRAVPLRCSYESTIDYAADVTRIRMSRGCLDHPGQIRVAVKAAGERPDGTIVTDWLTGPRAMTAWVSKG